VTTIRSYATAFAVLVLFDTGIQVALKFGARDTGEFAANRAWFLAAAVTPWIYAAIAGYIVTFVAWMTLLERAPVGPAFAASHLQVVTVLIASVLLFHEHLSGRQIAGAICIVAGIALLAVNEARVTAPQVVPD